MSYAVIKSDDAKRVVWIVDRGTGLSVTNGAERVCEELQTHYRGHRIIYRDTDGNWDELVHEDGRFKHFVWAREMAP